MEQSIEHFKRAFRDNLKAIREQRGYTQVELSEQSGFEASYVGKLERGEANPSIESIKHLCRTLDVMPERLLLPSRDGIENETAPNGSGSVEETNQELENKLQVHEVELQIQNEELQRTHQQLKKLRDHYKTCYDRAPVELLTVDSAGNIGEANRRAAQTLIGEDAEELEGKHLNEFTHPDDRDDFYRFRSEVNGHAPVRSQDVRLISKDGTEHPRRVNISILNGDPDEEKESDLLLSLTDIGSQG